MAGLYDQCTRRTLEQQTSRCKAPCCVRACRDACAATTAWTTHAGTSPNALSPKKKKRRKQHGPSAHEDNSNATPAQASSDVQYYGDQSDRAAAQSTGAAVSEGDNREEEGAVVPEALEPQTGIAKT